MGFNSAFKGLNLACCRAYDVSTTSSRSNGLALCVVWEGHGSNAEASCPVKVF